MKPWQLLLCYLVSLTMSIKVLHWSTNIDTDRYIRLVYKVQNALYFALHNTLYNAGNQWFPALYSVLCSAKYSAFCAWETSLLMFISLSKVHVFLVIYPKLKKEKFCLNVSRKLKVMVSTDLSVWVWYKGSPSVPCGLQNEETSTVIFFDWLLCE